MRHDIACAAFAAAALGGYAQFELDFVKAQTRPCMAGNLSVRNSAAYADDHGGKHIGWLLWIFAL